MVLGVRKHVLEGEEPRFLEHPTEEGMKVHPRGGAEVAEDAWVALELVLLEEYKLQGADGAQGEVGLNR